MSGKSRILLFSTLFPSSARPGHGIFVETRLRELLASNEVEAKVVAPVPWFFSESPRYGEYADMARTPARATRNGIDVLHPRYLVLPRIGMNIAPLALALGAAASLRRVRAEGFDFDAIDAHYYYPDGVAAALLSSWFKRPFVVTARGSDINLISQYAGPRAMIGWAARKAGASIAVSGALARSLEALDARIPGVQVLRNGVDLERFHPMERHEARVGLGWPDRPTLAVVGNLVGNKGQAMVIEALVSLPGFRLVLVGKGPDRPVLEELARARGVADRVAFAGAIAQTDLYRYFSAADVTVLASEREGWPNVLLESMACGTPVVATRVGGVPEIISTPESGRIAGEKSVAGLVAAIAGLMADYPDRNAVRKYAERFGWGPTTQGQIELFRGVIAAARRNGGGSPSSTGRV